MSSKNIQWKIYKILEKKVSNKNKMGSEESSNDNIIDKAAEKLYIHLMKVLINFQMMHMLQELMLIK